jgi:hypothetical protein
MIQFLVILRGVGGAAGFIAFMYLLMWLMSRGDYDRGMEELGQYEDMRPQDIRYLSTDEWAAFRTKYPHQYPNYHYKSTDGAKMWSLTPRDISDMTLEQWGHVSQAIMNPPPNDFQMCMDEYIATGDPEWLDLALSELDGE